MPDNQTIRGRFEDFPSFRQGLRKLKETGCTDYSAYSPVAMKDVEDLMPATGSTVRAWATASAIFGLVSFWYMCVASSLIYALVVGGKPPVSNVPFVIVSYEGTILMGSLGAFLAVLIIARLRPGNLPKDYDPRFSGSEFGIVVRCDQIERERVMGMLRESGAAEIDEITE